MTVYVNSRAQGVFTVRQVVKIHHQGTRLNLWRFDSGTGLEALRSFDMRKVVGIEVRL